MYNTPLVSSSYEREESLPTEDHTSTSIVFHTDYMYSALDLQLQNLPRDLYG